MSKIIKLEGTEVYIGMDDQKIVKAPISAVNYPNPQVGDEIRIFKDGDTTIIARAAAAAPAVPQPQPQNVNVNVGNVYVAKEKHMNKHVFAWVGNFLFGAFVGTDRFHHRPHKSIRRSIRPRRRSGVHQREIRTIALCSCRADITFKRLPYQTFTKHIRKSLLLSPDPSCFSHATAL